MPDPYRAHSVLYHTCPMHAPNPYTSTRPRGLSTTVQPAKLTITLSEHVIHSFHRAPSEQQIGDMLHIAAAKRTRGIILFPLLRTFMVEQVSTAATLPCIAIHFVKAYWAFR
jgi:hypothetical protein